MIVLELRGGVIMSDKKRAWLKIHRNPHNIYMCDDCRKTCTEGTLNIIEQLQPDSELVKTIALCENCHRIYEMTGRV